MKPTQFIRSCKFSSALYLLITIGAAIFILLVETPPLGGFSISVFRAFLWFGAARDIEQMAGYELHQKLSVLYSILLIAHVSFFLFWHLQYRKIQIKQKDSTTILILSMMSIVLWWVDLVKKPGEIFNQHAISPESPIRMAIEIPIFYFAGTALLFLLVENVFQWSHRPVQPDVFDPNTRGESG